jgi:hypothetical protein
LSQSFTLGFLFTVIRDLPFSVLTRRIRVALGLLPFVVCHLATDACATQKHGPPSPLPEFSLIEDWQTRTADSMVGSGDEVPAIVTAVTRLCRYFDLTYDEMSPMAADLSPLEWPRVFAGQAPNPRRMSAEYGRMLEVNRLAYRPMITLEPRESVDSLARAIADGSPVLLNTPKAPILYGYDLREPDPWWWVQWPDHREIMLESERIRTVAYWSDDPAAGVAWAVTSPDSEALEVLRDERARGYQWLRTVTASVRGDASVGLRPYPLSLRAFRDSVEASLDVPKLLEPIDPRDPLGVRRAREMRSYAVELLEWLTATATDTLHTQPMRLALYYYHNAIEILTQLDTLLYDAQPGPVNPDTYRENWRNDVRKPQIVAKMTDLLEWEKQAAQQLAAALSVSPKQR